MRREANTNVEWNYFGILDSIQVKPNVVIITSKDGTQSKCSKKFFAQYKQAQLDFDTLKGEEIEVLTRTTTSGHKSWQSLEWFTEMRKA